MDPNVTVTELQSLRKELATAMRAKGTPTAEVWRIRDAINERQDALRDWHDAGGFAPRIGWRAALAL